MSLLYADSLWRAFCPGGANVSCFREPVVVVLTLAEVADDDGEEVDDEGVECIRLAVVFPHHFVWLVLQSSLNFAILLTNLSHFRQIDCGRGSSFETITPHVRKIIRGRSLSRDGLWKSFTE